jgi:hypothetical protein
MKGGELNMKKMIATAVTIGGLVSAIGFGTAFAQTATPTVSPTPTTSVTTTATPTTSVTTTVTPTPKTGVTVPSGAPATGFGAN